MELRTPDDLQMRPWQEAYGYPEATQRIPSSHLVGNR